MTDGPGSYLKFLPALYAAQPDLFLSHFLDIFQKLLTGLDDKQLNGRKGIQQLLSAPVIGNLFYARFSFLFPGDTTPVPPISGLAGNQKTAVLDRFNSYIGVEAPPPSPVPPAKGTGSSVQAAFTTWLNDFLGWLGGWVALVVESDWSIDKKRTVILQILALYRVRGTAQGMKWLVELWLDLPLTITGAKYSKKGEKTTVTGTITVTIANPTTPAITLTAQAGQKQTFTLRETAQPGMPLVSGYAPWLFTALITLPNTGRPDFILTPDNAAQIRTLQRQLAQVLDQFKPAGTQVQMQLTPALQLQPEGRSSQLGINTFLGTGGTK